MQVQQSKGATIFQAIGMYVKTLKEKDKDEETYRELQRFVTWCGQDRVMSTINPSFIGDYADSVAGAGGAGIRPQAAERLQAVRKFLTFAHKEGITERRLATHVRIRRSRTRLGAGGVQEDERIQLTSVGYAALLAELETLKSQRPDLAAEIQRAAADKDVRENAPLDAAREEQGRVEARISSIENTLNNSVVIDESDMGRSLIVKLGATVKVKKLSSSDEAEYTVVSASEAKPLEKPIAKISDESPLGKELIGKSVNDDFEVKTPRATMTYRILSIS